MATGRLTGRSFWGSVCSEVCVVVTVGEGEGGEAGVARLRGISVGVMALGDTGNVWIDWYGWKRALSTERIHFTT